MPETILIARELFFQPVVQPAIVTWNRLEGRSRKKDFDRSLKAEVRDPLWMICRQWQFGECRAEDAGSAMKAKVQLDTGRIDRYSPIGEPARAYDDRIPLEVRVEREPVPMTLATRVQIGRHWSKLLGSMWDEEDVQAAYLEKYSIDPPTDAERAARLNSDHKALAYHSAVAGRVVDGEQLLDDINSGEHETFINGLVIPDSKKGALRHVEERQAEHTPALQKRYAQHRCDHDAGSPPEATQGAPAIVAVPAPTRSRRPSHCPAPATPPAYSPAKSPRTHSG